MGIQRHLVASSCQTPAYAQDPASTPACGRVNAIGRNQYSQISSTNLAHRSNIRSATHADPPTQPIDHPPLIAVDLPRNAQAHIETDHDWQKGKSPSEDRADAIIELFEHVETDRRRENRSTARERKTTLNGVKVKPSTPADCCPPFMPTSRANRMQTQTHSSGPSSVTTLDSRKRSAWHIV